MKEQGSSDLYGKPLVLRKAIFFTEMKISTPFHHKYVLVIASQKLVLRIVLPNKSIQDDRDVFFDEMVLILFMDTNCEASCKKVECCRCRIDSWSHGRWSTNSGNHRS